MQHHYLARVRCFLLLVFISCIIMFTWKTKVSSFNCSLQSKEEAEIWARMEGPLTPYDPQVLQILKNNFLAPPSTLPYNFSSPLEQIGGYDFSWPWIHDQLKKLFGEQFGGFFIEAGALDGEYLSNTLWLEQFYGWTGLLVEPDEESYKMLVSKHRKAWTSNTCLSAEGFPKRTILVSRRLLKGAPHEDFQWAFRGQTHEMDIDYPNKDTLEVLTDKMYSKVQCFPLQSYLLALNVTTVDLLSLDVQGTETTILRSFLSSSQISVRVIVVEDENKTFNHALMTSHGYVLVASDLDHVYVKLGDPIINTIDSINATTSKPEIREFRSPP